MPATTSVATTGNNDIDGVLSGIKWASPSLTFSFPTALNQYGYSETGFEGMNGTQQAAVRDIFDMIESVCGLTFTEVTETTSTHGTIRFAEENNAGTAYGYYPSSAEQGGDIWLNHNDYNSPIKGTYAYATFIHEIGHTLGLDHGQDGLAALPSNHDSLEYSVMTYRSYVGAPLTGYTVAQGSYPVGLMLDDIAALQYMYGANYNTNSGNTVYHWSTSTGELTINGVAQGASTTNTIFQTLWDGGGVDTYDFSNYTTNLTVDLNPGG
ncbi:MAG: M10 family metallopeptidase, partial [Devosia sp.]